MRRVLLVLFLITTGLPVFAQAPAKPNSADMYLALRKLNVLGSVLYIAAHPDDENTKLITWLSKDRLYRTGYLSLTRGDGGQNLIGDEQGIELGLIRTQELLSARRTDGGEQFFSRAYDFGFSKNPEETFTKWHRDTILSDVVWVIRRFQPDIIITRFPTTGEGGHGHHTASAILANEAFTAAADPNKFPEQLKYVKPWQARRVLWNSFNFGGGAVSDKVQVDVGGYNPLLGKSYGEIAAESRSQHKSQGFGVAATRGESFEGFRTTAGSAPATDPMDDIPTTWSRVGGGEAIGNEIVKITAAFDLLHPERSVPALVGLYRMLNKLPDGYWKTQKMKEVKDLVEQCSGLFIDATTNDPYAVQTDSVRFNLLINNRLGADVVLREIKLENTDSVLLQKLEPNRNFSFSRILYVPVTKATTQPYWLMDKMQEGYYTVNDQRMIGQPDVSPAYEMQVTLAISGEVFTFTKPVKYKFTDPVKGEVYQPFFVIPSTTVSLSPSMLVFRKGEKQDKQLNLQVNANKNLTDPYTVETRGADEHLHRRDSSRLDKGLSEVFDFTLSTPAYKGGEKEKFYPSMNYVHKRDTLLETKDIRAINYDHIPAIRYLYTDYTNILNIDLKTYNQKIGYIPGAGDKVPGALEQMGYDVTILSQSTLATANLSQFDAIITGVRAYNTNDWMNANYARLMKYVNDGGNLIVQYNTNSNIGPIRAKMGPFNFDVGRVRVTDENATVTFLKPSHPVLNFPNKIGPDDFKGWIQERSIYHASNWAPEYETIFSINDPGESPDAGSLIIAPYGRGFFTYTGIVFFRELPAGVPGAYRLMANLIALNKKKPI